MDRLSSIVAGLVRIVWSKREYGFFTVLMVASINERIGRVGRELNVLMAAFRTGTLRTRRSPAPGLTRRKPSLPPAPDPLTPALPDPLTLVTVPLPRGAGWLVRVMGEAIIFQGYVEQLLTDPEMQALLAASPRAVRAIRPLCRMLGIATPKPPAPVPPAPVPPAPVPPAPVLPTDAEGETSADFGPGGPGRLQMRRRMRVLPTRPGRRKVGLRKTG